MKVLTATNRTQGQRSGDFHWCTEGEIVMPPIAICDRDRNDPNGGCGCGRSWSGLNSRKATTTAMVRDIDRYTAEHLTLAVRSSLEQSGRYPDVIDETRVAESTTEIVDLAESYPVGAVLEIRDGAIRWRDDMDEVLP